MSRQRLECVELAPALVRRGQPIAPASWTHSKRFATSTPRPNRAKPLECAPMPRLRVKLSRREHKYPAPSTATRLCNKAGTLPNRPVVKLEPAR